MKNFLLSTMLAVSAISTAQITTSDQYTAEQLVNDFLNPSPNIIISNVTSSTGTNFGSVNGLGSFNQNGSTFPFESGIILSTGSIATIPGPNTEMNSGGNGNWPGDPQLVNWSPDQNSSTMNATLLEFDFVASGDILSIDYMFASEEYGLYQCDYGDEFAIIITDVVTGAQWNLVVLPGTTLPVSVVTVRDNMYNSSCSSVNAEYFYEFYNSANTTAPINYNGITVPMSAETPIIPNNPYHIKFVIADRADTAMDSALFLNGMTVSQSNLNIGQPDDLSVCDTDGDGIATFDLNENSDALMSGYSPSNFTLTYHTTMANAESGEFPIQNPTAFANATAFEQYIYARLESNNSPSYGVAVFSLLVHPEPIAGEVDTIAVIDNDANGMDGVTMVDLTSANSQILAGASPNEYAITFYNSQSDAMSGPNPIVNAAAYTTITSTVYFRLENMQTGCYVVHPLNIVVLPADYATPLPEGEEMQTFTEGETLADLEVQGENIQWYASAGDTAGRTTNDNDDIPLPMSTPLVDNTTYYASQTVYGIESLQRLPVTAMAALSTAENAFAGFTFYPNPVKEVLTIASGETIDEVVVYNLLGQALLTKVIGNNSTHINLSGIPEGVYVIKVTSSGQEKSIKIIKQ